MVNLLHRLYGVDAPVHTCYTSALSRFVTIFWREIL